MFRRFTPPARQVVVLAQDEARALRHGHIGAGHLLLGLVREEQGLAARVLASLGVTASDVRARVARSSPPGHLGAAGTIPFTPSAQTALERALDEASTLGQRFVGTEHLLLGLVRDEGSAAAILGELGVEAEHVRRRVLDALAGATRQPFRGHPQAVSPAAAPGVAAPAAVQAAGSSGESRAGFPLAAVVLGWLFFGVALGLGLVLGWLIWGS